MIRACENQVLMKIPKKAKRVFKGVLFSVYHWQQKMFDGSYATFEMLERAATASVIAMVGDKIIVLMQRQPMKPLYPSLPGGRINTGEKPIDAAARELLEETGYRASKFILFDVSSGLGKLYFPEYLYVAKGCKKIADQNLDGGEKIKVTLVDFNDFLQLCRNKDFTIAPPLRAAMYEALLEQNKRDALRKKIFS